MWERPGIQTAFCLGRERKLAFTSISKMHKTLLTREKKTKTQCGEIAENPSHPPTTTTLRRLRHGNEESRQAHQANRVRTETAPPPPDHSREEEPELPKKQMSNHQSKSPSLLGWMENKSLEVCGFCYVAWVGGHGKSLGKELLTQTERRMLPGEYSTYTASTGVAQCTHIMHGFLFIPTTSSSSSFTDCCLCFLCCCCCSIKRDISSSIQTGHEEFL